MAKPPANELKQIGKDFKFYTDAGSLKALKNEKVPFLKSGSGGQTKANTTIPIWTEDDEGFDAKDYKEVIVKVYSVEKKSKPKSSAKPVEYLYLLALIGAIVAGYFIILVL